MKQMIDQVNRLFDIVESITNKPMFKFESDYRMVGKCQYSPSVFKNIDSDFFPENFDQERLNENNYFIYGTEAAHPNINWPIDVSILSFSGRLIVNGKREIEAGKLLKRLVSVNPREARGKSKFFSDYMCVIYRMHIDENGKTLSFKDFYSYVNNKWISENGIMELSETLMFGIALRHRYEWGVSLGLPNMPSVRFNIQPDNLIKMFKDREKSQGKIRRDKIINWVTDHWRKDNYTKDEELYVRKHLRGGESFWWNGYKCEILTSNFDKEQSEKYVKLREEMRTAKTDRRKINAHCA